MFDERNADPNLIDKLTTEEELSGIFNVLMVALRRVLQRGRITMNQKTIAQRRSKYEMISNPVKCFVETAFEQDSLETSDFTTKDMVFKAYQLFCKENKIAAVSKEALGKKL
jgi:putative DNA primase/helicase